MNVLLAAPDSWYARHMSNSTACRCTIARPDPKCDVGESLWRLGPGSPKC
jgi:hypothetical protein